jgi:hypothetical protein
MTRRCRVESQETGDIIVQHDPLTDTRSSTGSAPKSGALEINVIENGTVIVQHDPLTQLEYPGTCKVSVSGGSLVVTIPYSRRADVIAQHDPLTDTRSSTGSAPKSSALGGDECQRERYGYRPTLAIKSRIDQLTIRQLNLGISRI